MLLRATTTEACSLLMICVHKWLLGNLCSCLRGPRLVQVPSPNTISWSLCRRQRNKSHTIPSFWSYFIPKGHGFMVFQHVWEDCNWLWKLPSPLSGCAMGPVCKYYSLGHPALIRALLLLHSPVWSRNFPQPKKDLIIINWRPKLYSYKVESPEQLQIPSQLVAFMVLKHLLSPSYMPKTLEGAGAAPITAERQLTRQAGPKTALALKLSYEMAW